MCAVVSSKTHATSEERAKYHLQSQEQAGKGQRVANKTAKNRSCGRVTLNLKMI